MLIMQVLLDLERVLKVLKIIMLCILDENCTYVKSVVLFLNTGTRTVIAAIDRILDSSETRDMDECESALEALGQIGSCKYAIHFSSLGTCCCNISFDRPFICIPMTNICTYLKLYVVCKMDLKGWAHKTSVLFFFFF